MHYVTNPEPVEMDRTEPIEIERNGKRELSMTVKLSLPDFLHTMVFVRPGWRDPKRPNRIELLISLGEKFPVTLKPGTIVPITDAEHEALCEEGTLRDMQISPASAVLKIAYLQRAILMAPTQEPKSVPAAEAAPSAPPQANGKRRARHAPA